MQNMLDPSDFVTSVLIVINAWNNVWNVGKKRICYENWENLDSIHGSKTVFSPTITRFSDSKKENSRREVDVGYAYPLLKREYIERQLVDKVEFSGGCICLLKVHPALVYLFYVLLEANTDFLISNCASKPICFLVSSFVLIHLKNWSLEDLM